MGGGSGGRQIGVSPWGLAGGAGALPLYSVPRGPGRGRGGGGPTGSSRAGTGALPPCGHLRGVQPATSGPCRPDPLEAGGTRTDTGDHRPGAPRAVAAAAGRRALGLSAQGPPGGPLCGQERTHAGGVSRARDLLCRRAAALRYPTPRSGGADRGYCRAFGRPLDPAADTASRAGDG